jgi:hypothetical protein
MKSICSVLAGTAFALALSASTFVACADDLPIIDGVEIQPLAAQARRIVDAIEFLGAPLSAEERARLDAAAGAGTNDADATKEIQTVLDPHCLFVVNVNPEMRVKVARGAAHPDLVEKGWRQFLVKVVNESGATAPLSIVSPQSESVFAGGASQNASDRKLRGRNVPKTPINSEDRWLDLQLFDKPPVTPALSGLKVEYRIVSLYARDAGKRDATFAVDVGQGTQDLGFRGEVGVLFDAAPAREITLRVRDEHGAPTTASLLVLDHQQRVYPSPAKRLAPDFGFQRQIYRADGETLRLPDGQYTIECSRGPESIPTRREVRVDSKTRELKFDVQRWIDAAALGWWSGDHHIHAAGCAHYTNPTEGVHAPDMARHCRGEDLKVGCNLTWGPCFDYQKQFFTGRDDAVSKFPYLLRYDIEVSGFGSHKSGHLCLLRLKDQMYPGGDSMNHWPTLGLNTLKWAKKQGALCGPAHSGAGLQIKENTVLSYEMPPFNGIGANEYIVDVTHTLPGPDGKEMPAVDFVSTVDTPYPWELNIWYHTLNAGFRTRISGETDFPCVYGERVGLGRSYVKLPPQWTYEDWCEGIRAGRNYVGDGASHLIDFQVNDVRMGEGGSELQLKAPGKVSIRARVAARLKEEPDTAIKNRRVDQQPYWHLERARIENTREVPVELIMNGKAVAKQNIAADGMLRDISFDQDIAGSSWVALRILPSSHTNPVFIVVGGKPIRPSKKSAEWCRRAVDQCWSQKVGTYAEAEMADARAAYDHARGVYDRIVSESAAD